jgi:hypothetical protein
MKIYYHSDLDGKCAAAIAIRWADGPISFKGIDFIEINYWDLVDLNAIKLGEEIIIVDFSFKPEIMEEVLKKTNKVIWLDHHKTAFEYKYSREIPGIRDINYSGCELAWMYFRTYFPMPRAVELIGDRDKWAWKFGEESRRFNEGIKLYKNQPTEPIWDDLFLEEVPESYIEHICEDGRVCINFRDNFCAEYVKSFGFETEFEGHNAFALGLHSFGSEAFGDKIKTYPLCITFEFNGRNWSIGLYSETIDVGKLAVEAGKKYGALSAGGHSGAAGMVLPELPFRKTCVL